MGPVQSHAPAALQDQVYERHHKYDQGGDSENPTTADENREGTMKIHGVVGLPGDGKYATRETSCFQECCYKGGEFVLGCPGWERREV